MAVIRSEPRDPALVDDYIREMAGRGQVYLGAKLPADLDYGPPGECFVNCLLAALRSDGKYQYCEGIGLFNLEAYVHSWLTDGTRAYDLTWRAVDNITGKSRAVPAIYKGVVLDLDACRRYVLSTKHAGVIPNRHLRPKLYQEVLKASNVL